MCVGGELTFTQKSREVPIIIFFSKLRDFQDFINFCKEDAKITGSFFSERCTTAVKNSWRTRDRVPGLVDGIKSKLPPLWVRDHAAPSLLPSQSAKW